MEMDELNYSIKEMENKRKNFQVYEDEEEEGVELGGGCKKKNGGGGGSGRWQPTKEQIEILEGVYAGGVKTPSAEQIQQITARLSAYGRIQGKNVFYWFQNTKARRRHHHKTKHTHDHDHDRRLLYHPPIHPGFYFLPYAAQDQVVPSRMWGPQQPAECKATLELFPLHPGPGGGVATTSCSPPPPAPAAYHHHHHHHTSCQQQHQHQPDHSALLQPAGGPRAGFIDFFSANPHS